MADSSSLPPAPPGALRRLMRAPAGVASMALLLAIVLLAVFGPIVFHLDGHTTSVEQFAPPSLKPLFGTDLNGRDLFARVLEGARISLLVGFFGALVSFVIGTAYGLISGYAGGAVDSAMMRLVEILYAIPRLILIIIASFVFDPILRDYLADFHLRFGGMEIKGI